MAPLHRRVGFQVSMGYRMRNPHHQAIKLAVGPIFYLGEQRRFYLQTEYFFRHWWLTNTRIVVDNCRSPSSSFNLIRTERINVVGMKALLGVNGYVTRLTEAT
jgi:hypothetical protein